MLGSLDFLVTTFQWDKFELKLCNNKQHQHKTTTDTTPCFQG